MPGMSSSEATASSWGYRYEFRGFACANSAKSLIKPIAGNLHDTRVVRRGEGRGARAGMLLLESVAAYASSQISVANQPGS